MVVNARLDEDAWLSLRHETTTVTTGDLDAPSRTAQLAGAETDRAAGALMIARPMTDDPSHGPAAQIGAAGPEVLRRITDADPAADLRSLIERGFHDAKEV